MKEKVESDDAYSELFDLEIMEELTANKELINDEFLLKYIGLKEDDSYKEHFKKKILKYIQCE
jgi:hypothetical protein